MASTPESGDQIEPLASCTLDDNGFLVDATLPAQRFLSRPLTDCVGARFDRCLSSSDNIGEVVLRCASADWERSVAVPLRIEEHVEQVVLTFQRLPSSHRKIYFASAGHPAERAITLMGDVVSVVSGTTPRTEKLRSIGSLLVNELADLAVIDLVDDDHLLERTVVASHGLAEDLAAALAAHPPELLRASSIADALADAHPTLVDAPQRGLLRTCAAGDVSDALANAAPSSVAFLPITAHRHTAGVITLATTQRARLRPRDLPALGVLAQVIGLALATFVSKSTNRSSSATRAAKRAGEGARREALLVRRSSARNRRQGPPTAEGTAS